MSDGLPPPMGSFVAGCAQLAIKHAFGLTVWREVDPAAGKYRVNVRLGNHAGPYPHWTQTFDLDHPIEAAVERVAAMAWSYFTSTGYTLPDDGLTEADIKRTPAKMIVSLKAEREERDIQERKRSRR